MNMATRLMATCALALAGYVQAQGEFTRDFPLSSCTFVPARGNPYFPITVGQQSYFSNAACVAAGKCDALTELWITMEPDVRRIPIEHRARPVLARVMEERESEDGDLVEVSRNFVSDCFPSHDLYYFGEEVDIYEHGEVVDHEGAWLAGVHGARPGILMPEDGFMVGSRYFQELAPGVALDRAEHKRAGFSVRVPAGRFDDCVEVEETTPLEAGKSIKVYCRGVGLVRDDDLELTAIYGHH